MSSSASISTPTLKTKATIPTDFVLPNVSQLQFSTTLTTTRKSVEPPSTVQPTLLDKISLNFVSTAALLVLLATRQPTIKYVLIFVLLLTTDKIAQASTFV